MKNNIYIAGLFVLSLFSCNSFMDLDNYQNIPTEDAYENLQDVQNGLNGAYNAFGDYRFYGRNVVALGDMASDNAVADGSTGHFVSLNTYVFSDTDEDLDFLWLGGYRVLDRTTRTIQGAKKVLAEVGNLTTKDSALLYSYISQCYALRALSFHSLVNIFGLPYVKGQENSQTGIVLMTDAPIPTFSRVARSSVQQAYAQILADIADAKTAYKTVAGYDEFAVANDMTTIAPNQFFMNEAAIYALQARVALFMGEYDQAVEAADSAINKRNSGEISDEMYLKMWTNTSISDEDIFTIAKSENDNLSSDALNTLYGSYGGSLTDTLIKIFSKKDIRLGLIDQPKRHPKKFDGIPTSGAVNNIPVFRKSEMYLIKAEAYARKNAISDAQQSLFMVAKRDKDITQATSLPSAQQDLITFIAAERRRELFEEGFRWYDTRRNAEVIRVSSGTSLPFDVARFVYPIPANEVNSGFGVLQNPGWENNLPDFPEQTQ